MPQQRSHVPQLRPGAAQNKYYFKNLFQESYSIHLFIWHISQLPVVEFRLWLMLQSDFKFQEVYMYR